MQDKIFKVKIFKVTHKSLKVFSLKIFMTCGKYAGLCGSWKGDYGEY